MAKGKYSKTQITHSSRIKPPITRRQREELRFSFKYLELNHSEFNLRDVYYQNYINSFLSRLKDISRQTFQELKSTYSRSFRFHQIDWERASVDGFGIPQSEQYNDKAFQFSLTSNEHGRVHGFILNFETHDVFYVVWLDPQHRLFS